MEQNMPVKAKRVWSLVRVMFYMLRKGLSSKGKFMTEFNMMMKRGKIAGKALQNLMFHHHHAWSLSTLNRRSSTPPSSFPSPPPGEYEFSCSNSPAAYPLSLFNFHKKHNNSHFFSCAHAPKTDDQQDMVPVNAAAVMKALEMLHSEAASPALPGFGKSPMVRQLRITDSPFPLQCGVDEDSHVDEAAEEFIKKFYNDLRRQNKKSFQSPLSRGIEKRGLFDPAPEAK